MKSFRKNILMVAAIGLCFGLVSCTTKKYKPLLNSRAGINFQVISLIKAMELAKTQNKPIFVFAHASWCPTCKKMEQEILNQKKLGDVYNSKLLSVAIDIDSQDGHQLNKLFPIKATPTLLFFKSDGSLFKKIEGYTAVNDLLAKANELIANQ